MEQLIRLPLKSIVPNPANPRLIKDFAFASLKKSLAQFPQMLQKRGIAVSEQSDGRFVAIGGNQRYRALCDLKKEVDEFDFLTRYDTTEALRACLVEYFAKGVPCVDCSEFTAEQAKRFIIADNLPFAEWDTDALANEWDTDELKDWGMSEWQLGGGSFSEKNTEFDSDDFDSIEMTINLKFTEDQYSFVNEKLGANKESKLLEILQYGES